IKGLRSRLFKVPLADSRVEVESKFLSENVNIGGPGLRAVFRFSRGQAAAAGGGGARIPGLQGPSAPTGVAAVEDGAGEAEPVAVPPPSEPAKERLPHPELEPAMAGLGLGRGAAGKGPPAPVIH